MSPRLLQRLSLFALTIAVPLSSSAATVAEVLKVHDDANVSRGEFLRASVSVLGIAVDRKAPAAVSSGRRVPKALQPYVNTAKKYDALTVFGSDLSLGKAITRSEAVTLLVQLQKLKPVSSSLTFTDIKEGSEMEAAARVAIEKEWLQAVRPNFFGAERTLTGREAKLLLRKAAGEKGGTTIEMGPAGETKVPSVVVKFKKREVPELPESELLRTVWQLLNEQYLYNSKVDNKEAAYKAAEALVNSVGDPYTTFMRPAVSRNFQQQIDGEVSGIGAQVEYKDNALVVIAPITGSPAEKAGIKAGDLIIAIDGETLAGLDLVRAVDKVRGPKGTTVVLTIKRDLTEMEITVKRDTVRMPEIDISYQNEIAIVKLVQFGQTTDRELRSLLIDVQNQKPKGLILDLRNNPGGLLHAAEITLSNFLPQGSGVAQIKYKTQEFLEVTSDPPTIAETVPMVVLINKGSASASEIVAGALQDHKRAKIIGEKSFGKGTVQQIVEFRDGSSMKMTIAEWLSPKGRVINGAGVSPDVEVLAGEGRDEQLLKAIDMLR